MSDFHNLAASILKVKPDKLPPRITKYRDYKNFESKAFLIINLSKSQNFWYD